jgi:hypothetical protein
MKTRLPELIKPACTKESCPLVGQQHERCKAHNRAGEPCGLRPRKGQFVCGFHGGAVKAALEVGKQRVALAEISKRASYLVAYDEDDPETPIDGLLREVRWSGQVARALGAVCDVDLTTDRLLTRTIAGERMNVLYEAWERERMNHAKLCKMAIDAGIEQKQLDIVEQQGSQIVQLLLTVLMSNELGLTSEQVIAGKVVAARVIRQQAALEVVAG